MQDRVLLLGDPKLRRRAESVPTPRSPQFQDDAARLRRALTEFRGEHGFGRAIAAPQLGISHRFMAIHMPGWPPLVVNPEIRWKSDETFTLWDDCMSFPSLLVRVRRHASIVLSYEDGDGGRHTTDALDAATSELLQHEIDHLDGVLAVDHAIDPAALVYREVFDANREYFESLVDPRPQA